MNDRLEVRFRRLRPHKDTDIPLPQYMTPGAAGMGQDIDNPKNILRLFMAQYEQKIIMGENGPLNKLVGAHGDFSAAR